MVSECPVDPSKPTWTTSDGLYVAVVKEIGRKNPPIQCIA